MMEVISGDNWSCKTIKAPVRSSPTNQQTNTELFTGRMSFLSPNQQCQSTEATHEGHDECNCKRMRSVCVCVCGRLYQVSVEC